MWCAGLVSINGYRYFISFIDDATRCTWVYLLKSRDEVFCMFETFHKMVVAKSNAKIQTFRPDKGGEYMSHKLQSYLAHNGIESQTSCPYTPEQNGVAERKNRHLLEVTQALLLEMNVPKTYWSDGVRTACFLINRMP